MEPQGSQNGGRNQEKTGEIGGLRPGPLQGRAWYVLPWFWKRFGRVSNRTLCKIGAEMTCLLAAFRYIFDAMYPSSGSSRILANPSESSRILANPGNLVDPGEF